MKTERLGLTMIAATLAAIALMLALVFQHQQESRQAQIRNQGVGLARALSALPMDTLLKGDGSHNVLSALIGSAHTPEFGYGVVVDNQGAPLAEITSPGTIVPPAHIASEPSDWYGERDLASPGDGRRIREFYGPVMQAGAIAGHVRLGYFDPGSHLMLSQLSYLALLALPVFLLTPLFYFLVRREFKPLAALGGQLERLLGTSTPIEIRAGDDLRQFMQRFAGVVSQADQRMRALEQSQVSAVTTGKLLAYRKARMEAVVHALPDAVLVLDGDGSVTFANAKLWAMLGVMPEQAIGRPVREWCPVESVATFLGNAQNGGESAWRADTLEFSPPQAPDRHVTMAVLPLATQDSESSGAVAVLRDTTQQVLARRARDDFVAHVSHELKSPLQVLTMYSEMLQTHHDDAAMRLEAVNAIYDESRRMAELVNNMLSVSRIESGSIMLDRTRVKPSDLLRDVFGTVLPAAMQNDVHCRIEIPQDMTPLALDKGLFRIAVKNLLTNAIKYNRQGGDVTLTAEETPERVTISVRDTGLGIATEDQGHIFEKFFRSADPEAAQRGGHGLGLFLVRQIVELHQGDLTLESAPGEGSTFTIALRKSPTLMAEAL